MSEKRQVSSSMQWISSHTRASSQCQVVQGYLLRELGYRNEAWSILAAEEHPEAPQPKRARVN
jgi:hypothetical protein